MAYAFQQMLNNAIDHSRSETATIRWWVDEQQWALDITDQGVGVYANLRDGLQLANEFEAVQELSKGKQTTDPARHTGEGVFFTSRVVDLFRLSSLGVRWTVDNLRGDTALGTAGIAVGTSVFCPIDPRTDRMLATVFREFTEDHAFIRTRPVVKLFEIGTEFVSRSEARRHASDPRQHEPGRRLHGPARAASDGGLRGGAAPASGPRWVPPRDRSRAEQRPDGGRRYGRVRHRGMGQTGPLLGEGLQHGEGHRVDQPLRPRTHGLQRAAVVDVAGPVGRPGRENPCARGGRVVRRGERR